MSEPRKPPRPPTHVGDRGEDIRARTPGRGVPAETLPPVDREVDFESPTPPAMDPWTYRAIKKLRVEMLAADKQHSYRIDKIEDKLGDVVVSHAEMRGAFSVMTTAINDEREEKKQQAKHKRRVALRWLQIFGAATSSGGLIVVVVIAILGRC